MNLLVNYKTMDNSNVKIKVCGMLDKQNISDLLELNINFIGFIFYPKSKRYIVKENLQDYIRNKNSVNKVGVFVNETSDNILKYSQEYNLDYIQLHGNETSEFCKTLKTKNIKIIKAFQINNNFNFSICKEYQDFCEYFLFDTQTTQFGGSGKQFNWDILQNYKLKKSYFLSGGISLNDTEKIEKLNDNRIYAIDINSRFEDENGLKKVDEINIFINRVKQKK